MIFWLGGKIYIVKTEKWIFPKSQYINSVLCSWILLPLFLISDWVKASTMVGGKENFCKIQTSKTAISLFFGEFFYNLFFFTIYSVLFI